MLNFPNFDNSDEIINTNLDEILNKLKEIGFKTTDWQSLFEDSIALAMAFALHGSVCATNMYHISSACLVDHAVLYLLDAYGLKKATPDFNQKADAFKTWVKSVKDDLEKPIYESNSD